MRKGWLEKTLGDVCHVYQPETLSQKQLMPGEYPVYGANGQIGTHNQFNHEQPQLILGCRGSCGTVHTTAPRSWINGNAMVVQPKASVIDLSFLAYALRGGIDISDAITGTAQPQITRTSLMPLPIYLPEKIADQQRIVGVLDEAFAGLVNAKANAEKNLQNARALFDKHLNNVFARDARWRKEPLSEFCEIKHGFAFDGAEFSSEVPDGNPLIITPGNFTEDGRLLFNERNTKRFSGDPPPAFRFDVGDLVVVMTDLSSKMKILGKPAFVETDNVLHNQRIGRFVFFSAKVEKRFVYYFMMTDGFLKSIKDSSTGTMVKHTAPARILSNLLSFPSDTKQQLTVVSALDSLRNQTQRLATLYQQKLAALEALKKSLLHQAFTGQL